MLSWNEKEEYFDWHEWIGLKMKAIWWGGCLQKYKKVLIYIDILLNLKNGVKYPKFTYRQLVGSNAPFWRCDSWSLSETICTVNFLNQIFILIYNEFKNHEKYWWIKNSIKGYNFDSLITLNLKFEWSKLIWS